MRFYGLTTAALLYVAFPLTAQNPAAAPANPPPPGPERLDQLLKAWEQRMAAIDSFSTKATRTTVHALTKKTTTFVGEAALLKPNMARLDMTHQDEVGKEDATKSNFERLICNGQHLYEYSSREKKIFVHEIPKNDPTNDNLIFAFLRGMKAEEAKKRFQMTLTKESEWYAYVYISPKSDADRAEFAAAQMTIYIKNPNPANAPNLVMLPCRMWYKQPTGQEVTYMFSGMMPNAGLAKKDFQATHIPGYTVERANAPVPPQAPPKK